METKKTTEPKQAEELGRITEAAKALFQKASVVDVNYLVRSHIDDFLVGLDFLEAVREVDPDFKLAARKLCELSRDIRFASGYPDCQLESLKSVIDSLFVYASNRLSSSTDTDVKQYRKNITRRTKKTAPSKRRG